jgi:molecular chaperone HtpG
MTKEQGNLSIHSENIFPIIKKWLYSDHDIFVRELVSNGCDAVTKLKKLEIMGEFQLPDDYKAKIQVEVDPEKKTLSFEDNGIGMTADEVKEYINQIAFSGATDFLEKYKDRANEEQIIGHFGLGFYSAFMVADNVTIETKSYKEGSEAVKWESEDGMQFEMSPCEKESFGTKITLHLQEDCYEFSNEYRVREILNKYCSFMPVEIFLSKVGAEPEYETVKEDEVLDTDQVIEKVEEKKDDETITKVKIAKRPVSLSDTTPLWTKHPNDCTDEDYKKFYRDVFHDFKEPLFWIHLNMDYPFNLKGILYFPKINLEYEQAEGIIKLYNNQVFIADNIKEVIPEFLMLLKGVIDCPDLPLNVSRSALQNDGFVKKISDYITKKVADKLSGMCKTDRENYEKYWDDISPFIKFGCLKDQKFKEKISDYILYKDLDDKYMTLNEYLETVPAPEEEPEVVDADAKEDDDKAEEEKKVPKTTVYYVTDKQQQSQYINMFREEKKNAFVMEHNIDQPFISAVEAGNEKVRFVRIDAELSEDCKEEVSAEEMKEMTDDLTKEFRDALGKEHLEVKVEKLKNEKISSVITLSEEARRMQDMMKMYAMNGMNMGMGDDEQGLTLVLNANNNLVKYVLENKDGENTKLICEQLYDLALLANKPLSPEAMTKFVERSNEIMSIMVK